MESKDKDLGIFQNQFLDEITDVKISAVDSIDSCLVIGDEKGNITTYEINQNGKITFDHQQQVLKGKIEQIKCLPSLNLIYVLVNANLFGYLIQRLDLKFKFDTKEYGNVHRIAINEYPGCQNQILIITKKKKVKCFEYNPEISKLIETKIEELLVLDLPDIFEWYGKWFCYSIPSKKKFFWIDIKEGVALSQELEVTCAKNVLSSWLLYTNCIGIFMEQNTPKQINPITFSTKPLVTLNVYKNYVIALHESLIGVFDANDSTLVQEISLESGTNGRFLAIGQKRVFYINSSFSKDVHSYKVWELKELAFEKQINKLLNENKIEEALNILNNNISSSSDDKPKKIEQFFIDSAWACLKRSDFEKAYQYAKLTNFNPYEFIYLFKITLNIKILHDDYKHLNTITNLSTLTNQIEYLTNSDDSLINDALKMLVDLLCEKRTLLMNTYEIPKDNLKKITFITSENAIINLSNSKSDFPLYALYELLDTTVIKALVRRKENIKKAAEIIDSEYFSCDWEDLETFLIKENTEESKVSYAYLNEKRGKYEEALKIWQEYGNNDFNTVLSRESRDRTKNILKNSQDKKLFHDYIQWILVKYPVQAFDLYLSTEIVPVEYFFSTIIGAVEKSQSNLNLKEKFLEHYIESGCINERYHTILAEIYIEKLFKLRKFESPYESALMEGNLKTYSEKLDKLMRGSNYYNKNHILEKIKGSWMTDQEIYLYSKLNLHNEALIKLVSLGVEYNDFEKVEKYCLEMLPEKPDLFADFFKILSENYHNYINMSKTPKNEAEGKTFEITAMIYQKEMLAILKKYGDANTLDPFVVLQQLPSEWTINDQSLYEYLTKILKNLTHMSNKYKIAKNCSEMALIFKEKEMLDAKSKAVTIENETSCELCKKKIGNTIFCVYPNMKIYHHKCALNPNICPTTRVDFTKKHFI